MAGIEDRLSRLERRLSNLPEAERPERRAERLERYGRARRAYEEGATEPPDSHPDTLLYWRALHKYHGVVQSMVARGILPPTK